MQSYTVYEPFPAPDNIEKRAKTLVFVKEGFSLAAWLVPPVWLLANRLWLACGVYIVAVTTIGVVAAQLLIPDEAVSCVILALNVIIGFEARDLLRADLEARGYVPRAIVSGGSLEECEYRYLREWLPDARLDRARLNAEMAASGGTDKRSYKEPVIGMFPAHGG